MPPMPSVLRAAYHPAQSWQSRPTSSSRSAFFRTRSWYLYRGCPSVPQSHRQMRVHAAAADLTAGTCSCARLACVRAVSRQEWACDMLVECFKQDAQSRPGSGCDGADAVCVSRANSQAAHSGNPPSLSSWLPASGLALGVSGIELTAARCGDAIGWSPALLMLTGGGPAALVRSAAGSASGMKLSPPPRFRFQPLLD